MSKNKRIVYFLTLVPIIIILSLFVWIFTVIFEGENPMVNLAPTPAYLSGIQKFSISINDRKRGLKSMTVSCKQGGKEVIVFEKQFPFKGFINRQGDRDFTTEVEIDPEKLRLTQGRMDISVQVWDYSRRGGGDGNMTLSSHEMTVDTIPPSIKAISRMHNVNKGGTGMVLYRVSSDAIESGLYAGNTFFPGYASNGETDRRFHVVYFTVPHNAKSDTNIYLWAKDKAGNISKARFYHHIRNKRFRSDKINISDKFLEKILPYFSDYLSDFHGDDIAKFLKINNDIRKEDNKRFYELAKLSTPEKLWEGKWLRLENSANMAGFADLRTYYYKGEKIDEKYHLGIDLASLANSPVTAANHGRVIFAEKNGIYGLTIVIDHGQGLMSLYGHLSSLEVKDGQSVKKGDIIGHTGQTGLAGGDHLHFGILVNGFFVNPIEWWDSHWIEDNITKKFELIEQN
ncbi:MAG: M23 family metallopeptidase [Deltaproteobacteria bacterium]|nr:M23 family metallopeptidase [Deltaproteobacteria bacterium]